MKQFTKIILSVMLVAALAFAAFSCKQAAGGDGSGNPSGTSTSLEKVISKIENHGGTIKGAYLTVHGKVKTTVAADRYARLPASLFSNIGSSETRTENENADLYKIRPSGTNKAGQNSAGIYFSFETNTTDISLQAALSTSYASLNEASKDVGSKFDLYKLENEKWVYVSSVALTSGSSISGSFRLNNSAKKAEKYLLLFPMYNQVLYGGVGQDITLRIDNDAEFIDKEFMGESTRKPIVIYGTSITNGASADRPGEAYTNRVMLETKHEVINMGFDGSAFMGEKMGDFLADIPASVVFIDPTMNWGSIGGGGKPKEQLYGSKPAEVAQLTTYAKSFASKYTAKNPNTPVVLVSCFSGAAADLDTSYKNGFVLRSDQDAIRTNSELTYGNIMKTVAEELKGEGKKASFLSRIQKDGTPFIPTCYYDSRDWARFVHPDSNGMKGYADMYLAHLETITLDTGARAADASTAPSETPTPTGGQTGPQQNGLPASLSGTKWTNGGVNIVFSDIPSCTVAGMDGTYSYNSSSGAVSVSVSNYVNINLNGNVTSATTMTLTGAPSGSTAYVPY